MAAIPIIFGKPITVWTGLLVLSFLLATASYAILSRRGVIKKPFKYHFYLAYTTVTIGLIHGSLGIYAYFF
jgi:hypothetical protein